MTKLFIINIIFVSILFSCKSENNTNHKENDLTLSNLNGKIKEIQSFTYIGKSEYGDILKDKPVEYFDDVTYDLVGINSSFISNKSEFKNGFTFYNKEGFIDSLYRLDYCHSFFGNYYDSNYIYSKRNLSNTLKYKYCISKYWKDSVSHIDTNWSEKYSYDKGNRINYIFNMSHFRSDIINEIEYTKEKFKYEEKTLTKTEYDSLSRFKKRTIIKDSINFRRTLTYNRFNEGKIPNIEEITFNNKNQIIKIFNVNNGYTRNGCQKTTETRKYEKDLLVEKKIDIISVSNADYADNGNYNNK